MFSVSLSDLLILWDRIFKVQSEQKPETVVTRFVRLCEAYGIHRNQIPRFIGHGLTISDVQDDALILPKLTEELLDEVCERLAVRREWLDGAESEIYERQEAYYQLCQFQEFLEKLLSEYPEEELIGVAIKAKEPGKFRNAAIILQQTIGYVGDKPIYRYFLVDGPSFNYWKARTYFAARIAIAWRMNVYIHGVIQPDEYIEELISCEKLLGWDGDGIWAIKGSKWYPEDMAESPEELVQGIDAEEDDFGIKSAFRLWLKLEQQGYMDNGSGLNARKAFEEKLDQASN